ncbi:MAG: hypothetical protein MUC42_13500 [Bryobacter sp.]|nr:hypothetical protein [Bryobacter sp.]
MRRAALIAAVVAVVALFLIANRAAYEGFFSDDDLDNLSWTTVVGWDEFGRGFVDPKLSPYNFRPTGHIAYRILESTLGFEFPRWVAAIQLIHFLNAALLFLLLTQLGFTVRGAAVGVLVWIFHSSLIAAWWKPMYVFDLLCGTFTLLCLLAYLRGWLIPALLSFWLAYKAKEVVIGLPVAIAAWEWWLGERRWKRVLPFFAISASFGLQALFANTKSDSNYTLRFSFEAFRATTAFYLPKIFVTRWWPAVLPLFWWVRDKRVGFGLVLFAACAAPMFFLPGRLFSVYLYVPWFGLAIFAAALAERGKLWIVLLILASWWWLQYQRMKDFRREELGVARETRLFAGQVREVMKQFPNVQSVFWDGKPRHLAPWGVEGAIHYLSGNPKMKTIALDKANQTVPGEPSIPILSWNSLSQTLTAAVYEPSAPPPSYLRVSDPAALFYLEKGWHPLEWGFRWTAPEAVVRLTRPPSARAFELRVQVGKEQLEQLGEFTIQAFLNGVLLGEERIQRPGVQGFRWPLPAAPPGPVEVKFWTPRSFRVGATTLLLGVPVTEFGFTNR